MLNPNDIILSVKKKKRAVFMPNRVKEKPIGPFIAKLMAQCLHSHVDILFHREVCHVDVDRSARDILNFR